jgi:hypothetical protein
MKTAWRVALTFLLCLVWPLAVLLDLILPGAGANLSEEVAQTLRRIWAPSKAN